MSTLYERLGVTALCRAAGRALGPARVNISHWLLC